MHGNGTLVTGATGFIGTRLVERLRELEAPVHVLVRSAADTRRCIAGGCKVFRGDVTLLDSICPALAACDVVIHCAVGGSTMEQAHEINVQGTLNVLAAAAAADVRRVVHLSSVVAHGRRWPAVLTEEAPLQLEGDPYAATKAESESAAMHFAEKGSIEVVVVRPTIVYGPRSGRILSDLGRVNFERVKLIAHGRGMLNLVYVDDVVDAVLLAASSPDAANQSFLISGEPPVSAGEYFTRLAQMCGKPSPPAIGRARARVEAVWSRWYFRFTRRPRWIEDSDFTLMGQCSMVSISKARRVLGFEPRVSFDEGMQRTEAWLRRSGHLPAATRLQAA